MRKSIVFPLIVLLMMPAVTKADSYSQLWKQAEEAAQKDLPKTEISVLEKISAKAEAAADYGQLMKAELRINELQASISADSVAPTVARMELKARSAEAKDPALAAVYYAVLGSYYDNNSSLRRDAPGKAASFYAKAMRNPALLASKKATALEPFVVKGRDSQVFDHDLLSLIGYQCGDYKGLHSYYKTTANRAATLLTALEMMKKQAEKTGEIHGQLLRKSRYAAQLDSLIELYSDLKACGQAAIERADFMARCADVKTADHYNYIYWALNKWGDWAPMNTLRNDLKQMTNATFSVQTDHALFPSGTPFKLAVSARNVKTITISLSKTTLNGGNNFTPLSSSWLKEQRKRIISGSATTLTYSLVGRPEYELVHDSVTCEGLPRGVYIIDAWADGNKSNMKTWFLYISDLYIVEQGLPGDSTRIAVLNAKTGQPASGATLVLRGNDRDKATMKCDSKGETIVSGKRNDWNEARAYTAQDNAMPFCYGDNGFYYHAGNRISNRVDVFTDRSIYRPGQTVHAALTAFKRANDDTETLSGQAITLQLRDANNKTVEEKRLVTDSLGNAWADFSLPSSGLTGSYRLYTSAPAVSATSFRVEEYKRPTFTIELPEVNQRYQNGDTIVVTAHAKTFAGVPVQGASVRYKVRREQALWWRLSANSDDNGSDEGVLMDETVTTDSAGAFKMEIPMALPDWEDGVSGYTEEDFRRIGRFYNITANIEITDAAGETRTAQMSLPLGSKPTSLTVELPSLSVRDSLKTLRFNYRNMAGKDISGTVRYQIDGSNRTYEAPTNSISTIEWNTPDLLKSGSHTLKAVCGTDTLSQTFTVFSLNDTAPCVKTHDWFYRSSAQFPSDGSPVYIQIGSSDEDVHVLYTAVSGDKTIASGTQDLSNSIMTRALTYRKEYGDGLKINLAWVKNGHLYTHNTTIVKPLPDKSLKLKWVTFRDKLTPGGKEEWTLNITKPDGTPAEASLMATLYDSSLDLIAPHSWSIDLGFYRHFPYCHWSGIHGQGCYLSYNARLRYLPSNELTFSRMDFTPNLEGATRRYDLMKRSARARGRGSHDGEILMAKEEISQSTMVAAAYSAEGDDRDSYMAEDTGALKENAVTRRSEPKRATEEDVSDGNMQLRENLNETAYFAPALRTDSKGNVLMSFTLPESVTTWRFLGLAHDRFMNNGSMESTAIAKKTVMIQPNMPRFARSGDKLTIAARLFNTAENAVSGTARLQLIDPETEAIVMEKSVPFKLAANSTGSVSFSFQPSDERSLLICKVMASGVSFSDGEQHYLPILPNREMTVNTLPFTQTSAGTQNVDLKALFPKGSTRKSLTVEYTNNPAWLMIQALPYIGTTSDKNAMSLSTALYANMLSYYIIGNAPQVKAVFEQWKREPAGNETSLMSALDKNQELKTLVLDETPWVADARNEASQKRSLANYFDTGALQSRITATAAELKKLQNAEGSWSWWPGMKGSANMTMTIARQMARLQKLTGDVQTVKPMLDNALKYLGQQAVKEYQEAKKNEKKYGEGYISESFALNYLYINALTGRKPAGTESTAARYMLTQLKKADRHTSLMTKALMAVVLAQQGETALAKQYIKSLEEYSVSTKEMGRYYDSPRADYSWCDYRIPTQVAAMEAMTLVDAQNSADTVDEMKRWLLQQKRTQGWSTPVQSADAVYAFLNGNTAALQSQPKATLKVDGRPLETSDATAGIGYIKATVDAGRASKLTVEKRSEGISWGAVYALSMQKTTDIEDSKAGFSVKRELLTADGKAAKTLRAGDRVKVRITVKADRDYDFVQIKDCRAACMEPVEQLSGYRSGCYQALKDNATCFYFDRMSKGVHTLEASYYVDRTGVYETGTCAVQCAYAPEYTARTASLTVEVK